MKRTCILLGKELSASNDSRAHVIPSALGGRLKRTGLLSAAVNLILNDRVLAD